MPFSIDLHIKWGKPLHGSSSDGRLEVTGNGNSVAAKWLLNATQKKMCWLAGEGKLSSLSIYIVAVPLIGVTCILQPFAQVFSCMWMCREKRKWNFAYSILWIREIQNIFLHAGSAFISLYAEWLAIVYVKRAATFQFDLHTMGISVEIWHQTLESFKICSFIYTYIHQ